MSDPEAGLFVRLLTQTHRAARLLMWAMESFHFAIGCFAAGSLTSARSDLASTEHRGLLNPVLLVALITGVAGLVGLIAGAGCSYEKPNEPLLSPKKALTTESISTDK